MLIAHCLAVTSSSCLCHHFQVWQGAECSRAPTAAKQIDYMAVIQTVIWQRGEHSWFVFVPYLCLCVRVSVSRAPALICTHWRMLGVRFLRLLMSEVRSDSQQLFRGHLRRSSFSHGSPSTETSHLLTHDPLSLRVKPLSSLKTTSRLESPRQHSSNRTFSERVELDGAVGKMDENGCS